MLYKRPSVLVAYDERAQICVDEWDAIETRLHTDMIAYSQFIEWTELPDFFTDNNPMPTLIMTEDKIDLQRIDYVAGEFEKNTKTLVLWAGEGKKPETRSLPAVSWQQLKNCRDIITWDLLYKLSVLPDGPTQ